MDWVPFVVSVHLGLWVTAILLVIAYPLAWWFVRSRSWISIAVESLFSLPTVLAPTVIGFYLLLLFSTNGPIGLFFLETFGLRLAFSFSGIVVASCIATLPFMLSSLKAGLAAVERSQLEAAYTLGKGRVETFFRVVLPQTKVAAATGIVLTFAHTLGEFGVVLMIGGSLPGVTKVVSIAVFERVESLDFSTAHTYALTLIAVSYPAVFFLNALQKKRRGERR